MKKTTLLFASTLGVMALALTACGGSSSTDTAGSAVIPDVVSTATPTATPVATGAPEQATTANDPLQSPNAKPISATKGQKVTLKGVGTVPAGGGMAVLSSNTVALEPVGGVDMKNVEATFTAKEKGDVRVAIGFTDAKGAFTGNWTTYLVTIK